MTGGFDPAAFPLSGREGLPPALQVLADAYPREAWEAHDHFNGMVRFWLERHLMFRRLLAELQLDAHAVIAREMAPETYAPRLSRYGGIFLNELHTHHQVEDTHYFPRLAAADPRAARGFDLLDADHHAIDPLLHGMAEAANAVLQGGQADLFADRLRMFAGLLDRHLTDEEEIVVPAVLSSGFDG